MPSFVFKTSDSEGERTSKLNLLRQSVNNISLTGGVSLGLVSDTAYASSWDAVTTIAPSKNAVYDKIEAMISDTAYNATTWDTVTTITASKNALRDKFEALVTTSGAMAFTDTIGGSTNVSISSTGAVVINEQGNAVDFRVESDTNAGMLFVDGTNNRVGVGTQTPTVAFNVEGATVFNDTGADVDFRVEGDTDVNMIFGDASADRVGIGTNAPSRKLHVSSTGDTRIRVTSTDGNDSGVEMYSSSTFVGGFLWDSTSQLVTSFYGPNIVGSIHINSSRKMGFGAVTSAANILGLVHIKGLDDDQQLIIQNFTTQNTNPTEWWSSGSVVQAYITSGGGAVLNESGGSGSTFDTRMEGDTVTNLFHLVSSEDRIYIGASSGGSGLLHVAGTINATNYTGLTYSFDPLSFATHMALMVA